MNWQDVMAFAVVVVAAAFLFRRLRRWVARKGDCGCGTCGESGDAAAKRGADHGAVRRPMVPVDQVKLTRSEDAGARGK